MLKYTLLAASLGFARPQANFDQCTMLNDILGHYRNSKPTMRQQPPTVEGFAFTELEGSPRVHFMDVQIPDPVYGTPQGTTLDPRAEALISTAYSGGVRRPKVDITDRK